MDYVPVGAFKFTVAVTIPEIRFACFSAYSTITGALRPLLFLPADLLNLLLVLVSDGGLQYVWSPRLTRCTCKDAAVSG